MDFLNLDSEFSFSEYIAKQIAQKWSELGGQTLALKVNTLRIFEAPNPRSRHLLEPVTASCMNKLCTFNWISDPRPEGRSES